ncbi:MAG TPA: hypothetical protein VFI39_00085 [Gemmatimonadales bacterium]|nr:hypothetical protein [Gemmatimonadales bacterium]
MAALGSWPSIKQHGLLSTSALLDLYGIAGRARKRIEAEHRPQIVRIVHSTHGEAFIRDQKPMDDRGLVRALEDAITPAEWYGILNAKVFFWVTKGRLERLLAANAYRSEWHDVLLLDTASVLRAHASNVKLAGMNTGSTKPFPHKRGRNTFLPLALYPFAARLNSHRNEAVVEFAVEGGVPDAANHALKVYKARSGKRWELLWER